MLTTGALAVLFTSTAATGYSPLCWRVTRPALPEMAENPVQPLSAAIIWGRTTEGIDELR